MSLSLVFSFILFSFLLKHYISLDLIISLSNCTELMLLFSLSHSPSITFFSCDDYSFAVSCVPENNFFSSFLACIYHFHTQQRREKWEKLDGRSEDFLLIFALLLLLALCLLSISPWKFNFFSQIFYFFYVSTASLAWKTNHCSIFAKKKLFSLTPTYIHTV